MKFIGKIIVQLIELALIAAYPNYSLKLGTHSVILLADFIFLMTQRSIAKLRPIKQRANLFAGD